MNNNKPSRKTRFWRFAIRFVIALYTVGMSVFLLTKQMLLMFIASTGGEDELIRANFITLIPFVILIVLGFIFLFPRSKKAAIVFLVLFIASAIADVYFSYDFLRRGDVDNSDALGIASLKFLVWAPTLVLTALYAGLAFRVKKKIATN